ncbi:Lysosomal acid lipase/cholesteryl ester hydrolase [Halotydeus destructor]|nr:Lysosomal acid lipase/cholesteryl ester hydrolase [Halotydeus destructor]
MSDSNRSQLCFFALILFSCWSPSWSDDIADQKRTATQLIESRGFVSQTHKVTTQDGYILTMHRIVNPFYSEVKKRPIILQHGLLGSSAGWLINEDGPWANSTDEISLIPDIMVNGSCGNNIGFELSLRGYDVWMPNSRGNFYSLDHLSLNSSGPNSWHYWEFSFDELIKYDLPATIDYVRKETDSETVGYVGHSQGSLIMFGLMATQPKYSDIIKPFIAMAPVTTINFMVSPIRYLSHQWIIGPLAWKGGPFMASNSLLKTMASWCPKEFSFICSNLQFVLSGFNPEQYNERRSAAHLSHMPQGTSFRNMVHYARNYNAKKFQMYETGNKKMNFDLYGSETPPVYPLENIASEDIHLMYADNDFLVDLKDVELLKHSLSHLKVLREYRVPMPSWNHLDFVLGKDAGFYINSRIIKILDSYEPNAKPTEASETVETIV